MNIAGSNSYEKGIFGGPTGVGPLSSLTWASRFDLEMGYENNKARSCVTWISYNNRAHQGYNSQQTLEGFT